MGSFGRKKGGLDVGQNRAKLPKLVGMAPRDRDHEDDSANGADEDGESASALARSGEFPSATESAGPASCASPRWTGAPKAAACAIADQQHRVRLIADLSKLLHDPCVPEAAKTAGLTLIGWLARRQPGEDAHGYGVAEAQRARSRRVARR